MPVNIATGAVRLEFEDVAIPGKVDLVWDRLYSTTLLDRAATPMGLGWTCRYFATLSKTHGGYQFVTPEGDTEEFLDSEGIVDRGGVVRRLGTFEEIFLRNDRYVVQQWDVESGEVRRYCFATTDTDQPWRLASIEDVSGQGLDIAWDRQGRLVGIRQRLERRAFLLSYDAGGFLERVVFRAANSEQHLLVRYEHDAQGHLTAAYDAADYADRFEYDQSGRVSREIVKDGGVFVYRYDEKGRCVRTAGQDRYAEKRLRYFEAINLTEVTDSYDHTFRYRYLPSGQMVQEIDPLGGEKNSRYDEHGRLIAKTDPTGAVSLYTYDEKGNRATITDALGNTTALAYNDSHLPVEMTDPLGHVWRRVFDDANRLVASVDALDHRWTLRYDAEGNIAAIQNPMGAWKYQKYTAGVLEGVTDWLRHTTRFVHDGFGRVIEFTGPVGDVSRIRYDAVGNPIEVTSPDGATQHLTYDTVGNLTSLTDGNGYTTRFRYGPCERLLESIDPSGGVVRYRWGSEPGWLDQVINEKGETYRFVRNAVGRIVRSEGFDGAVRHFTVDAAGYVVGYANANGENIAITRDALHRVIGQTLPDGEQVTYAFDPVGYMVAAANADIAIAFERDAVGQILREVQGEHWVESRHDAIGNVIRTVTSLGHAVDYEVDANGFVSKLTTLGNQSLEFRRNGYGQEIARRMPGGVAMEQRYDPLGQLVDQRIGPGRVGNGDESIIPPQRETIRRSYSYDRRGSLTSIVDGRWGRVDYVYDPADRLLQTLRERGLSEAFVYDPAGNVTRVHGQGEQPSDEVLVYGRGNRLLQKGTIRYEYDAEGRRIKKVEAADGENPKVWLYEWNPQDRLKAVTRPNGDVWQYKYDPLTRRVGKVGPNTRRQFIWHEDVVVQEAQGGQSLSAWMFDTYTYAPLATVQHGRMYPVINDHLGTPREIIDSGGSVVWSMALKSWGQELEQASGTGVLVTTARIEQNLRFPGQYFDSETGLHYNRHRYYDPDTGSYTCDDPIGLLGGLNGYQYGANPTGYIDPWGLAGDPAKATHVQYEGVKDGKPYIGYASKPGHGHKKEDVVAYRYPKTDHFDVPPKASYVGDGLEGKATARGLEQRVFEDKGGCKPCPEGKVNKTSNKQNPVGENNPKRDAYLAAADKHRAEEAAKKEEAAKQKPRKKGKKVC